MMECKSNAASIIGIKVFGGIVMDCFPSVFTRLVMYRYTENIAYR